MITTIDTLPPEIQASFDDKLLSVRTPNLIYKLAADKRHLKAKGGTTLRMSRYDRLPTFPVPLGPTGATIPATPLSRIDIDATVSYYGQYVAVNQQVSISNQDPVLNQTAQLLGLSLRMTEDQLMRDMLMASASVVNFTGGLNGDVPSDISPADIDTITSALLSNDAWMILNSQMGEDRFGTGPVRDAFIAMGHTKLTPDLNALPGFISKWNYPNDTRTHSSEWGSFHNVRFFVSSVAAQKPNASASGATVFPISFMGMEAVACVEQDNFSARFLYRPPVFSDPLFQNVTLGTTFAEVPRILNDLWVINGNCTLSS